MFYFTMPNTDLQSLLVLVVCPCCYVTDASRAFKRHGLSAQGNIIKFSFDWLTLQSLLFPHKYNKHSKIMAGGCKQEDCLFS